MEKLKASFRTLATKVQTQQPFEKAHNTSTLSPPMTSQNGSLAWPPRLLSPPRIIGEVTDASGRPCPRDQGRSSQLGGKTYYLFGDTFCFDASGEFVGVTNNCIGIIPDLKNPTTSQWLTEAAKVPEFIPLSDEEKEYGRRHAEKGENKRFVNWCLGGIIERPGSDGKEGWLFYDTVKIHGATEVRHDGTGVAKATVVNTTTGEIECKRVGKFPLFDPEGPLWGNMSNLAAPDGYTYLLSGLGLDNYMARIRTDADFSDPANYTFLSKDKGWISSYSLPCGPFGELKHDILESQGQGAILYLPFYAPPGKPYLWFGNSKFLTSELWIGAAERPEGPWDLHSLGELPKFSGPESGGCRYTIYPHVWGSDFGSGEVLITWSDNATMGGKVIAGILNLAVA